MSFFFLLLDLISFSIAIGLGLFFRTGALTEVSFISNLKILIIPFIISAVILWLFSFYDFKYINRRVFDYKNIMVAFFIDFFFSAGSIYFLAAIFHATTPKTVLLITLVIYFILVYLSRKIYKDIRLNIKKTTVVILGKNHTLDTIISEMSKYANYDVLLSSMEVTDEILNTIYNKINDINFIVISSELLATSQKWQQNLLFKGAIVKSDLDFFEELFSRVPRVALDNNRWLLEYISSRRIRIESFIKRLVDITCSLLLMPFCLTTGIVIYLLILIVDKQFPLFVQERVGLKGKTIYIYKFKTMFEGTENVTKMGKILRKFRLDEFPQIINIFIGDTSFVGPRPLWTKEYEYLNSLIDNHPLRTIVRPGITGWAQLNYKAPNFSLVIDKPTEENKKNFYRDAKKRLAYDLWYIKNASVFLDMEIILRTIRRMFISDKKIVK
ncbi:sugar transferase [Candidatus Ruminimicrobium bovinum]|uniref:sugar transferase n=1 Tax=Candidatus Ruminimicrobium bovinum TaxID=3242779 RepID=UPI0039B8B3A1